MSNEITLTSKLTWARGGASIAATVTQKIDQTGATAIENIQVVGTASETIVLGDVTDPAYLFFKNENDPDDANFPVYIGNTTAATTGNTAIKLLPGQGVAIATSQTAWYAIATGGNVNLLVVAVQR